MIKTIKWRSSDVLLMPCLCIFHICPLHSPHCNIGHCLFWTRRLLRCPVVVVFVLVGGERHITMSSATYIAFVTRPPIGLIASPICKRRFHWFSASGQWLGWSRLGETLAGREKGEAILRNESLEVLVISLWPPQLYNNSPKGQRPRGPLNVIWKYVARICISPSIFVSPPL